MRIYCIIPVYNEEAHLANTIHSLVMQTHIPHKIIIVDDNSTDSTFAIAQNLQAQYPFVLAVQNNATAMHLPGSKVIKAFQKGLQYFDDKYDIITKFDGDLIFPSNYIAEIVKTFQSNSAIGMVGGFCYIQKNNDWVLENLTDQDHIRGALKAYRKECFEAIGGLKPAMGWDTVDELLAKYHGWHVVTLPHLKVKHLKPTGANYNPKARFKQGEAFYTLGYGFLLTFLAAIKLSIKKKKIKLLYDYLMGYWNAKKLQIPKLVTPTEEKFIRNYRWNKIKQKIFH